MIHVHGRVLPERGECGVVTEGAKVGVALPGRGLTGRETVQDLHRLLDLHDAFVIDFR